jgi:hypothetical protein
MRRTLCQAEPEAEGNMTRAEFRPGWRCSTVDAVVLVIGAVSAGAALRVDHGLAIGIGLAVGHFFLFCNVFRIRRTSELIWAGAFVALVASTVITGRPGWSETAAMAIGLSACLILLEMRLPSYHGIGWRRINPGLEAWWLVNGRDRGAPESRMAKSGPTASEP